MENGHRVRVINRGDKRHSADMHAAFCRLWIDDISVTVILVTKIGSMHENEAALSVTDHI